MVKRYFLRLNEKKYIVSSIHLQAKRKVSFKEISLQMMLSNELAELALLSWLSISALLGCSYISFHVGECCAEFYTVVQKWGCGSHLLPLPFSQGLQLLLLKLSHAAAKQGATSKVTKKKAMLLFHTCTYSVENGCFKQVIFQ